MNESTTAILNKIDNAHSFEELDEILKNLPKDSFCVRVDEMRQAHDIKSFNSILKDVTMSKSQFFDVLSGKAKPQKHHVIKIGIAMKLSVQEINELLKLAHLKELYAKDKEDVVIMFGIQNGLTISDIQEKLEEINASFSLLEK